MRYILLEYVSGGSGQLFQIHDDAGQFIRFADMDGNTIDGDVNKFSATLVEADVAPPAWHQDEQAPESDPGPAPVPESITKRQFLIQLVRSGMVAPSETATVATQPPALVSSMLSAMPEEAQIEANLTWASMTQVLRFDPLVVLAVASGVMTDAQADDFFRAAAAI